jgi:hypothetical protein
VSAYLIKSDMSKLKPAEMAQYFEDRLGWAVTTAWNLNVKDFEQTISGVCKRVCFLDTCAVSMCSSTTTLMPACYICDFSACNHVDMLSAFLLALVHHSAIELNEALHYMSIGCVVNQQSSFLIPSPLHSFQVVRKPEEGEYIGHLRAEALMEMARIFQVTLPVHPAYTPCHSAYFIQGHKYVLQDIAGAVVCV